MNFDDLEKIDSLVHYVWDAAALTCLERQSLRYTDLGKQMALWSRRRPTDSELTRTVKRLRSGGLITQHPLDNRRNVRVYSLTPAGRERLAQLRAVIQTTENSDASSTTLSDEGHKRIEKPSTIRQSTRSSATAAADRPVQMTRIDITTPHPARRYNYWLGGKDNFAVDRESGDQLAKLMPTIRLAVAENRRFQRRVMEFLARDAGIRQFLDIGTGIPAPDTPHEVAQAIDPRCRVVYVDNDPVVLAHARALLTSNPKGATAYLEADAREPEKILTSPESLATLDFTQPIGLLMIAVLHFIADDDAYRVVSSMVRAMPSGSFLAISHATQDYLSPAERTKADAEVASGRHGSMWGRSKAQVTRFFDGLELVPPGVQPIAEWRAANESQPRPPAKDIACYGGVGRVR